MEAGTSRKPERGRDRPPDLTESVTPKRLVVRHREHETLIVGREPLDVRGQRIDDRLRDRNRSRARLRLGWPELERMVRKFNKCPIDAHGTAKEVDAINGQPRGLREAETRS